MDQNDASLMQDIRKFTSDGFHRPPPHFDSQNNENPYYSNGNNQTYITNPNAMSEDEYKRIICNDIPHLDPNCTDSPYSKEERQNYLTQLVVFFSCVDNRCSHWYKLTGNPDLIHATARHIFNS